MIERRDSPITILVTAYHLCCTVPQLCFLEVKMYKNMRTNGYHWNIYLRLCYHRPQLTNIISVVITRTVSIYSTASGVSFIISNNDSIDRTHLLKRKPPTYRDNNTISVLFTPSSGRHDALRDPTCRQPLRCLHERPRPRCRFSAARFMHHLVTSSSTAFVCTCT